MGVTSTEAIAERIGRPPKLVAHLLDLERRSGHVEEIEGEWRLRTDAFNPGVLDGLLDLDVLMAESEEHAHP